MYTSKIVPFTERSMKMC